MSASATENTFRVFFSWQSDLPQESTTKAIRKSLERAKNNLEKKYKEKHLQLTLDESTRDMPGSPNIPQAIFSKIEKADVFICDLTAINKVQGQEQKATPNPNVAIELGYAIAHLGLDRIVALFNGEHGTVPDDLPYDFDRNRVSPFSFGSHEPDSKEFNEARKFLEDLLCKAISGILKHQPKRPAELREISEEELKRKRDISSLEEALSTFPLNLMDEFLKQLMSHTVIKPIFHFWENFAGLIDSSRFHLNDKTALALLFEFRNGWETCLDLGQHFYPRHEMRYMGQDAYDQMLIIEKKLEECAQKTAHAYGKFVNYIRTEYCVIDLDETSRRARKSYQDQKDNLGIL